MIHLIVDQRREFEAGVIHVRAKAASARDQLLLARWYVDRGAKVIINSRVDIALAAGAAGVHLPADSIAPDELRRIAPEQFLIGVSCHTRDELKRAEREGADYAYLSPVFAPLSKPDSRTPLGLNGFASMIKSLRMPVFALGGITPERIDDCLRAGAAGVAGITLGSRSFSADKIFADEELGEA